MLRVFIITQDEPIYAPVYVEKLIRTLDHSVVGITALSPQGQKGWRFLLRQRLDMYGPRDFVRASWLYGSSKLKALLPIQNSRFYSVARVARRYSIPLYPFTRVNDTGYIETLKELDVDVLLSVAANQRFGPALLAVPRLACLNVHSSLLPRYRGLDGLFWALAHGESEVGVTVHLMSADFDDGAIVAQQPFTVAPDDTLHRLYFRAMDVGTALLSTAFDQFEAGTVVTRSNDASQGQYFSWPTHEAAEQFRSNGRAFF